VSVNSENTTEYYDAGETAYGLTYGQWTVKWWRWALSIPADKNPLLDETGVNASINQPQNVWFLGGIWAVGNEVKQLPSRNCLIPAGSSLLIPILNCEADYIELPEIKNEQGLLSYVSAQVNTVEKKECYVNDKSVSPQRVTSDPQIFDLYVHPDFDRYHKGGGKTRATSDGYWVFLKALPEGEHSIRFEGSYEHGKLVSGASYKIKIT
jgi:hypothetical protein